MKNFIVTAAILITSINTISAQKHFLGTLHYNHEVRFVDEDARKAYEQKIDELSRSNPKNLQTTLLKYGEMPHRRSYRIKSDRLLSVLRDADGVKILEHRVQQPGSAFRVNVESEQVTTPLVLEEKREKAKALVRCKQEEYRGYNCTVYCQKFKGGEVRIWVTDEIALPHDQGYFSELLIDGKLIVHSQEYNKKDGKYEEFSLMHLDRSDFNFSDDMIVDLKTRYRDTRKEK